MSSRTLPAALEGEYGAQARSGRIASRPTGADAFSGKSGLVLQTFAAWYSPYIMPFDLCQMVSLVRDESPASTA